MEMVWDPLFEPLDDLSEQSAQCPRSTLHTLLYILNKHASIKTNIETNCNALRIISMPDRSQKRTIGTNNPELPLLILHLGQERSVDIIPQKFDLDLLKTFDVRLGNFSPLYVLPETRAKLKINLPSERNLEDDMHDFHIMILPFREKTPTFIQRNPENLCIEETKGTYAERIKT